MYPYEGVCSNSGPRLNEQHPTRKEQKKMTKLPLTVYEKKV